MAVTVIENPRGCIIKTGDASCRLVWNESFGREKTSMFSRKQKVVDSEVLRHCAPYVPFRTGMLMKSGTLGTVIGSGEVIYAAPYARYQYYSTAETREYDPRRGGKWFERMKPAHREAILKAAERA